MRFEQLMCDAVEGTGDRGAVHHGRHGAFRKNAARAAAVASEISMLLLLLGLTGPG
jgi:hypothetical protein